MSEPDHFEAVYRGRAADYERLVAAEDVDRNLPAALERLAPGTALRVADFGTGTGRVARLLAPRAAVVVGLDLHAAMLDEQRGRRVGPLVQADNRAAPLRTGWADLAIAGWAIGHLRSWFAGSWNVEVGRVLAEMRRVTRPGGRLVICETLGTGAPAPAPPVPELAECYRLFEQLGFTRTEISTDYEFASADDAAATLGFFFGDGLVAAIHEHGWARVPEWSGIWTRDR